MANVKLVVMYPRPKDIDAFEKIYQNEHVPLAVAKLEGKTKIVANKVLASPQGTPPFYRIAEIHSRSMAGFGSMRRVRWWQAGTCSCRDDFLWRPAGFLGS
jgi:uncharacterized protein (TIGR02118 family)